MREHVISGSGQDSGLPLVSVGMAVYNEERFIRGALDSLLAQDYENIEIVISDNASTDRTRQICLAYVSEHGNVRYYRQEANNGASHNFHQVFQLASGTYFTWASGHDTRDPTCVRKCVEVLEQRPDVVLCYPRTLLVGLEGCSSEEMNGDTLETMGLPTAQRLKHVVAPLGLNGNAMYGVIRSAVLARITPPQAIHWADRVFLGELSLRGGFHQIDDRLFFRRQNRPPESRAEASARQYAMMAPQSQKSAPRYPNVEKMWELEKVAWRAPHGPLFKFLLAAKVPVWIWVPLAGPSLKRFYRRHPAIRRAWRSCRRLF